MAEAARPARSLRGRAPWWLIFLSAVFLGLIAVLVAASLLRPEAPPEFRPGDDSRHVDAEGTVWGRHTLDARDPDRWRLFSFERGPLEAPAEPEGWDLAVRRFRVVVNGGPRFPGAGGARELGDVALEGVGELPADGYRETRGSLEENPVNPALEDWYRYGFVTHLLRPRPTTFAIRTADGRYGAVRILSYYCPGAEPGCLTFAFVWRPRGDRAIPSAGSGAAYWRSDR